MKVHVPTPLRSYTNRESVISAKGATVADVLNDIDRRFPGFRFRIIDEQDGIREHIKIFVNENQVQTLSTVTSDSDTLHIICALSGGATPKKSR
jgi:sulfur-carrier protein